MRKLASIQEVKEIIKHPNAEVIELARVQGWQCVVKVNEFKQGDLGVYFEIDAFLPASDERYSFLEKQFINFVDNRGARIRTIKLRGELSQGLLLPLHLFPEITETEVGTDVTEILGIIKYEKPVPVAEDAKGDFPGFIQQTDQERVQNLTYLNREGEWEVTEKLDGTSTTIFRCDDEFGVCTRNMEIIETEKSAMWKVVRELDLEKRINRLNRNLALQGELIGPKIQSNRYKLTRNVFCVFDIFDIDNKRRITPDERKEIINNMNKNVSSDFHIQEVPFLGYVTLPEGEDWIEQLIKEADGKSVLNNQTMREGVVYKHRTRYNSFKVISNKYLLKHDE